MISKIEYLPVKQNVCDDLLAINEQLDNSSTDGNMIEPEVDDRTF